MAETDQLDVKIRTNVCVRSLLEFGFPKELIAIELKLSIERVLEAEAAFGGPSSFPSPVVDSMEYVRRFVILLNSPKVPIEDPKLLLSIDKARARILVSIIGNFFDWTPEERKQMIGQFVQVTQNSHANPNNQYGVGIAFIEIESRPPGQQR